jgi:hypothetical protein
MAQNTGTLIFGTLKTFDSLDTYPVAETNDILGSAKSVATLTDRDNIPVERRQIGMTVYVNADKLTYKLENGVSNSNWVLEGLNFPTPIKLKDYITDRKIVSVPLVVNLPSTGSTTACYFIQNSGGTPFLMEWTTTGYTYSSGRTDLPNAISDVNRDYYAIYEHVNTSAYNGQCREIMIIQDKYNNNNKTIYFWDGTSLIAKQKINNVFPFILPAVLT